MSIQIGSSLSTSQNFTERLRLFSKTSSPIIDLDSSTSNVISRYGNYFLGQSNIINQSNQVFVLTSNTSLLMKIDANDAVFSSKNIDFLGSIKMTDVVSQKNLRAIGFVESSSMFTCNLEVYVDDTVHPSSNVFIVSSYIEGENLLSVDASGNTTVIGNVGIGTFPQFALHVTSEALFEGNLHSSNVFTNAIVTPSACNLSLAFDVENNRVLMVGDTFVRGKLGADGLDFENFFSKNVALNYFNQSNIEGDQPTFQIFAYIPSTAFDQHVMAVDIQYDTDPYKIHNAFYVDPDGRIGIGTNAPSHQLSVELHELPNGAYANLERGAVMISNPYNGSSVFVLDCNIHVGIGTAHPQASLHLLATPESIGDNPTMMLFESSSITEDRAILTSSCNLETNLRIGMDGIIHASALQTKYGSFDTIRPFTQREIWFDSNIVAGISSLECETVVSSQMFASSITVANLAATAFTLEGFLIEEEVITLARPQFAMQGEASLFYDTTDPAKFIFERATQMLNIPIQGTVRIVTKEPNDIAETKGLTIQYSRGLVIDGTYDNRDPGTNNLNKSSSLAIISANRGISFIELMNYEEETTTNGLIGEIGYYNPGNPVLFMGFRDQVQPDSKAFVIQKLQNKSQISGNNVVFAVNDIDGDVDTANMSMFVRGMSTFVSENRQTSLFVDKGTQNATGHVGIHTTNPSHTLHVNGDVRISNYLQLDSGSSAVFNGTIDGVTNFSSNMNVNGTIYSKGHVSTTSDRDLKVNLERIPDALRKVEQLTGYTYNRIDRNGERETGLVAQEVQAVLPEVVHRHDAHLSIAYGNMAGIFVESIKALSVKVDALQKEIEFLKAQLN